MMRRVFGAVMMVAVFSVNAGASGQGDFFATMQKVMTDRANLCQGALILQATKERERVADEYKTAASYYALVATSMAGFQLSQDVFAGKGMSRWKLRSIARKCASYMPSGLDFSLGAVSGYPANDYLRAEACAATLNYGAALLEEYERLEQNSRTETVKKSLTEIRGRLNVYARVRRESLSLPAGSTLPYANGDAYLKEKHGQLYATNQDVEDCREVGQKILISMPDPNAK
ncbi:hypothetical protein ACFOOP_05190 [Marinicaulis aureus]|uniref:Sel1 repeat family protein n=1 Tax=Hyphococcus aureus TaxID=2666033 RepID=A0ABW1KW45_9PROT